MEQADLTATATKRTPGPWSQGQDYDELEGMYVLARDNDGSDYAIAVAFSTDVFAEENQGGFIPAEENMKYIVLACNHFEALLAVCEAHLALQARAKAGDVSINLEFAFQENGRAMEDAVNAAKEAQGGK